MRMSEQINELAAALAIAQGSIEGASKDSKGNFGAYVTLGSVWNACRDALSANGLSVVQSPGEIVRSEGGQGSLTLTTMLMHKSGQFLQDEFSLPVDKLTPQGTGSACTYARRYALMALVGIAPEDDDGQRAENEAVRPVQKVVPRPEQTSSNKDVLPASAPVENAKALEGRVRAELEKMGISEKQAQAKAMVSLYGATPEKWTIAVYERILDRPGSEWRDVAERFAPAAPPALQIVEHTPDAAIDDARRTMEAISR